MRRLNFTILTGCNSTSILTLLQSCNYLAVESLARLRREPDEDVGWGSLLFHTYYTEFHLSLVQHIGLGKSSDISSSKMQILFLKTL